MPWFKADDRLPDHRKVRQLGRERLPALGLWLLSGCWSSGALSDGFVPAEVVARWGDPKEQAQNALLRVGLWHPDSEQGEEGFRFHDWPEWQPTREQVETDREAAKVRQRRHRERARTNGQRRDDEPRESSVSHMRATRDVTAHDTVTHAEVPDPDPTRPDPTRPGVPGGTPGGDAGGRAPARVAAASGGPPPLPSELDDDQRPASAAPIATAGPMQPCGDRHDPERACRRCGAARRSGQEQADQATLAEAGRRAENRRRIDGCSACDDNGWLEHPESGTPVVRCDHETDPRKQLADALDQAS